MDNIKKALDGVKVVVEEPQEIGDKIRFSFLLSGIGEIEREFVQDLYHDAEAALDDQKVTIPEALMAVPTIAKLFRRRKK